MSPVAKSSSVPRWLTVVAAILVATIALLAFAVSFAALSDLADRAGIPSSIAWAWPIIVDGSIVTAMLVIFAWRGQERRATAWPWLTLIFFALVSIVGNGVHTVAVLDRSDGVSVEFAVLVGAIPPVALLLASEMLVRLLAGTAPATATEGTAQPGPEMSFPVAERVMPTASVATEATAAVATPDSESVPALVPTATSADTAIDGINCDDDRADTTVTNVSEHDAVTHNVVVTAHEPAAEVEDTDNKTTAEDVPAGVQGAWSPQLIEGQGIPSGKDAQIQFIAARAGAGKDVSKATIAELLEVSDRTAFRRIAEAKALDPEAFDAPRMVTAEVNGQ